MILHIILLSAIAIFFFYNLILFIYRMTSTSRIKPQERVLEEGYELYTDSIANMNTEVIEEVEIDGCPLDGQQKETTKKGEAND